MPLPLILGIAAGVAAVTGVGSGIHGGVKMKKASDTMKSADVRHKKNVARFESTNKETTETMDALGKLELDILNSFKDFSDVFEKIHNRPKFKDIQIGEVEIHPYNPEELKKASVGAGVLLGGLGGAALGTAGGFAAAGATTAAVMALGTASTGTAIASLSGVAATNATLAAIGGGSLAAGGLGVAGGTAILGGATIGVGLLVGGVVIGVTGRKLSKKADEAWEQMKEAEAQINKICDYLNELRDVGADYNLTISRVNKIYTDCYNSLRKTVEEEKKTNWNDFSLQERQNTENCVLLVSLLYNMCKVQLVIKNDDESETNKINFDEISKSKSTTDAALISRNLAE